MVVAPNLGRNNRDCKDCFVYTLNCCDDILIVQMMPYVIP